MNNRQLEYIKYLARWIKQNTGLEPLSFNDWERLEEKDLAEAIKTRLNNNVE